VRHGRYIVLQMAEVAVPRGLFDEVLQRIDRLRPRQRMITEVLPYRPASLMMTNSWMRFGPSSGER
jgi:hypothetical protein